MILKRTIGFTTLILTLGSLTANAAYPIWHDTTATAVVYGKSTCFIGIIRSGKYQMDDMKHKVSYMYIHLLQPINIFPISTTGDLWYAYPTDHQYDFGLVFNTSKMVYYTERFINKAVQIIGSISSPVHGSNAPTGLAISVSKVKTLIPSGAYENVQSVCHVGA